MRKTNVPLAPFTSLQVGGPAQIYVAPNKNADLLKTLQFAYEQRLPVLILGGGTNLIIRDKGVEGVVIHLQQGFGGNLFELVEKKGEVVFLKASAATSIPKLLHFLMQEGLGGGEFLAGIPGTVGGATIMNAGTKLGKFEDIVEEVTLWHQGEIYHRKGSEISFDYRESNLPAGAVVLEVLLRFFKHPDVSGFRATIAEYLRYRRATQPLHLPSCGSVFKNPLEKKAGDLIEKAGLKGLTIGKAQISPLHANFIVNLGGAKAADVLSCIEVAKEKVYQTFKIELKEEVKIVGLEE